MFAGSFVVQCNVIKQFIAVMNGPGERLNAAARINFLWIETLLSNVLDQRSVFGFYHGPV